MRNLLLCSGQMRWDGWVHIDGNPDNNPDICAFIPPIPAGLWDQIALIHGIEHFTQKTAREVLHGCYEQLAPGGTLILEQPDIAVCCKVVLGLVEHPEEQFADQFGLAGLYGDPRYNSMLMQHFWGYTPDSLRVELIAAGFSNERIMQRPTQFHSAFRDFRMEATK